MHPWAFLSLQRLQGAFFEHDVWGTEVPTVTVKCKMASELFDDESQDTPFRWVFNERFEAEDATDPPPLGQG